MSLKNMIGNLTTVIIYLGIVMPSLYTLLNPIGFWQNMIMLFTVDILSFVIISSVVRKMVDDILV